VQQGLLLNGVFMVKKIALDIEIIREKDPMIILKKQDELVENMSPSFWRPEYVRLESFLIELDSIRLGEIATKPISGYRAGKLRYTERGVAIIKVGDVLATGIDWSAIRFVSPDSPANAENKRVQEGDLLICRSGEGGAGRGKLCLALDLFYPSCVHGHVYRMSVKGGFPEYVTVYLKSKFGRLQIERYTSGVGSPELDADDIPKFLIPILPDQHVQSVKEGYQAINSVHNRAIKAKIKMLKAREQGNLNAERRFKHQYEENIQTAETMLKDLVRQLEEVIEGKRRKIRSVEQVTEKEA